MHITKPIRSPALNLIFKKDEKGNYTKDARLYQDILRYYVERRKENPDYDGSFKHRQLAKWLINNNREFINRYTQDSSKHTPIGTRIEHTQERTKDKLKDMVNLDLIKIVGQTKVEKGTGTTPLYQYTKVGHLLAWIVVSIDSINQTVADNEIYDLFVNTMFRIKEDSSSYTIFYHSFFKRAKENGFFGDIVNIFRRSLDSGERILSAKMLFRSLIFPRFSDDNKARLFLGIWNLTIKSMDQHTRELLYLHLKRDIEVRMERLVVGIKQYEELQYKYRDRVDIVILECFCKNCNLYLSLPIRLQEYGYRITLVVTADFVPTTCLKCKTPGSLQVPHLLL
jgi:RNase P subunit RPR2